VIGLTAAKRRNLFRRHQDERRQAAEAEQASLSERSALVASLRSRAQAEAAALLSGGSRDPLFEREVASHARRIAYHDFMRLLRPRLKAMGNGATEAAPRAWRLRPR
jgi:hypothetical protein